MHVLRMCYADTTVACMGAQCMSGRETTCHLVTSGLPTVGMMFQDTVRLKGAPRRFSPVSVRSKGKCGPRGCFEMLEGWV